MKKYKFILSGGGTGGHIFPALSIAEKIIERFPECELLFVGAQGKMEMKIIPDQGYKISGLWISGFDRNNYFKNILLPLKIINNITTEGLKFNLTKDKLTPDSLGISNIALENQFMINSSENIFVFVEI